METMTEFSFGKTSIAKSYDSIIVPYLFNDWAKDLINNYGPWKNKSVLDLASGTGIVLKHLVAEQPKNVIAVDLNPEMLALARNKVSESNVEIDFIESSIEDLSLPESSIDVVACQQGFQFFPDKILSAKILHSILKPGGRIMASTWCPVNECEFFGAICKALETIGEPDISNKMRIPFDLLSEEELESSFVSANFKEVNVEKRILDFNVDSGFKTVIQLAYATPIGPDLKKLSNWQNNRFKAELIKNVVALGRGTTYLGKMSSYILTASK